MTKRVILKSNMKPWHKLHQYNIAATIRYPQFPVQNLIHVAAATFPHVNRSGSKWLCLFYTNFNP
jgi:hypothetical protein